MNTTFNAFKIPTTPHTLRVADIDPSPLNPRKVDKADRDELAESLKAVGQVHRIWVRPHPTAAGRYELVDGERRWWGAQAAGLETLEASVGDWSDEEVVMIAFTTGRGARPLSPIGEARGLKWLKDHTKATVREIAERVGLSHGSVGNALTVMEGPEEVIAAVDKRGLPMTTAVHLVAIEDKAMCLAALAKVMEPTLLGHPPLSVSATKSLIKAEFAKPRPAPVVTADQVALTAEESLKVFPAGAEDPAPESGFVAYTRPIPPDLLKPEVAAGPAIKFSDVATGVTVHVGVDDKGKSVALVKVSEALVAVKPEDRHIFKEDVARTAGIPKPKRAAGEPPSRRVEEEAAEREAKKVAKEQRKKDKAAVHWLTLLRAAVSESAAKPWQALPYWTLLFDELLLQLTKDDVALLCTVEDCEVGTDEEGGAQADLERHAGGLPLTDLIGLVTLMFVVSKVRAEGADGALVREWHGSVVNPPAPSSPEALAAAAGDVPEEPVPLAEKPVGLVVLDESDNWPKPVTLDPKILGEWVKAEAGGMPREEIARSYGVPLADVDGALGVAKPKAVKKAPAKKVVPETLPPASEADFPGLSEPMRKAITELRSGKTTHEVAEVCKLTIGDVIRARHALASFNDAALGKTPAPKREGD